MVDIGPLFALGQGLAAEAIRTSGTSVRVESRTTTTDPTALESTVIATVQAPSAPAIVVPASRPGSQPLPGVELRWSDWKVILLPDHPVPVEGEWVVVETSLDPVLPGQAAKVLGHVTSSAGAVLTVYARPESS